MDEFASKRRIETGKNKGSKVTAVTVNKDLHRLRTAMRKAHKWGYLPVVPDFTFEREPKKLPVYVAGEHFAGMYQACDLATLPRGLPYPAADWWRGLLVTGYMTGWRISELLGLNRDDLDLEAGTAITRAEDNKGKRDEKVKLHSVVVEHVRKLAGFTKSVFPWDWSGVTLYRQFAKIQEAAGIRLACHQDHEHTRYCHVYGFHDLRRAFATMNADKITADALQSLMRHKSYTTTQRYIDIARQLIDATAALHVPDVLKNGKTGTA